MIRVDVVSTGNESHISMYMCHVKWNVTITQHKHETTLNTEHVLVELHFKFGYINIH